MEDIPYYEVNPPHGGEYPHYALGLFHMGYLEHIPMYGGTPYLGVDPHMGVSPDLWGYTGVDLHMGVYPRSR